MTKISVVIPCYNQGKYLNDALESVQQQTSTNFEIIVVNDGSTDEETKEILNNLRYTNVRVLHTDNQGLSQARNHGIRNADGEYILPLDADDRIGPTYLEKAVKVLEENETIGIVYCLAEKFGAAKGLWELPSYTLNRMLLGNLIFCSAMYRRIDWELAGGYNADMAVGWEDWDFWLSLIELGRDVYRIPEVLFYYRVKEGSMAASMDCKNKAEMHHQVMKNHKGLYVENSLPLLALYYQVTTSAPYRVIKKMKLPNLFSRLLFKKL